MRSDKTFIKYMLGASAKLLLRFSPYPFSEGKKYIFWGYLGRNSKFLGKRNVYFLDHAINELKLSKKYFFLKDSSLVLMPLYFPMGSVDQGLFFEFARRVQDSRLVNLSFEYSPNVMKKCSKVIYIKESPIISSMLNGISSRFVSRVLAYAELEETPLMVSKKVNEITFVGKRKASFKQNKLISLNVDKSDITFVICPYSSLSLIFILSGIKVLMCRENPFYTLKNLYKKKADERILVALDFLNKHTISLDAFL